MKAWSIGRAALGGWVAAFAFASTCALADAELLGRRVLVPLRAATNPTGEALRIAPPAEAEMALKGLAKAGATVTVNFLPAGPQGGDTCVTWDPAAQAAFSFAANIWGSLLQSAVPIKIDACWCSNLGTGVLGHAGPNDFVQMTGTFYPVAIANAISGVDQNGAAAEIYAAFSSTRTDWYFGTDGLPPFLKYDFVSVLLHEFGHGLGFTGSMDFSAGLGRWGGGGIPLVFDKFNENGAGQSLTNPGLFPNPSAALAAQLQGGSVFWNGANGKAAYGGNSPKLYAPNPWEDGSSISHLDFTTYQMTANGLMIPALFNGIAIHSPGPITLGIFKDMGWPLAVAGADLELTQTATPSSTTVGKDVVYTMTIKNNGPDAATNVEILTNAPAGATHIWSSPGCVFTLGSLTCTTSSLANGATKVFRTVMRPTGAGTATNAANVTSSVADANMANNLVSTNATIAAAPVAAQALRYRLYSPVTKEHHFTTDQNEYNVLGTYVGTWVQEGTVGKVLNNPGSFSAVTAVPYYRLYDTSTQWHHWTTDANEYYTLGYVYSGWNLEGVDGYILPSSTAGTTQLYRLNYPALGALHHWTIDANEYNTLITPAYGWVGEGGSGFVIQ